MSRDRGLAVRKAEVESMINPGIEYAEEENLPLQYDRLSRVIGQVIDDYKTGSKLKAELFDNDADMVAGYKAIKESADAVLGDPKYSRDLVLSCLIDIRDEYRKQATEIGELAQLSDDDYQIKLDQLITARRAAEFMEVAGARYNREISRVNKPFEDVARKAGIEAEKATNRNDEQAAEQFHIEQIKALSLKSEPDKAAKARFIQNEVERQMEASMDKYRFAVEVSKAKPEELRGIIASYRAKQERYERAIRERSAQEHEELLRGKVRNANEYELVREGILTEDQSRLFTYEQLNTYWEYTADDNSVHRLFDLAKAYYPGDEQRGLMELAQVGHEKNILFTE